MKSDRRGTRLTRRRTGVPDSLRLIRSGVLLSRRWQTEPKVIAMAKGQMRSSKEKKKPKAEWNKKKKGGAAASPFAVNQPQGTPSQNPFAKKS
jgi:hypothetical protein